MPYVAYGSPRDKQYRRAIEADNNPSDAQYQALLISPAPFTGNSIRSLALPPKGKKIPYENKTFLETGYPFLIGHDKIYAEDGRVPTFDMPIPPKGYVKPTENKTFIELGYPFLLGQDKINGAPGEVPNYDWPVPKVPSKFPIENRTFLEIGYPFLNGQDKIYGNPGQVPTFDLPNPPKGYPRPIENKTFIELGMPFLIGQDRIYGDPGEVPEYNWIIPKGPNFFFNRLTGIKVTEPDFDTMFGAPGQVPNYDLSLPNKKPIRKYPDLGDNGLNNLLSIIIAAQAPFALYDWLNPTGRQFPRLLRGSTSDMMRLLVGQDIIYGSQGESPTYDWIIPKGYNKAPNKGFQLNLSELLIGQDLMTSAISQYDWTVPKGYKYPLSNRGSNISLSQFLIGQDKIYAAAGEAPTYDWIVPKGYKYPQSNRGSNLSLSQFLIGQDVMTAAISQYDWPVPKGRPYPSSNRGSVLDLSEFLIGQDTFYGAVGQVPQFDLPNPTPARGRIRQDFTFNPDILLVRAVPIGSTLLWVPDRHLHINPDYVAGVSPIYFPVLFPHNLYDWPNPEGLTKVKPLFYFIQGNLLLEVSHAYQRRVVQFIPNELKNVLGGIGFGIVLPTSNNIGTDFNPNEVNNPGTTFNPDDPGYTH